MGKLNYVNRKSEGIKLGVIVAKDLGKRRKPATHRDLSPLDINLAGKHLTDEGLAAAAHGLQEALIHNDDGVHTTRLQALHLTSNGLTAKALASLAPSIQAAAQDLEELDLSHNNISVISTDDTSDWECFLDSLASCSSLRRLDLSHNNFAGVSAWEVLAKVYTRQFAACHKRWEGSIAEEEEEEQVGTNGSELTEQLCALNIVDEGTSPEKSVSMTKVSTPANTATGLPSILHLLLSDTAMEDCSALFLSYIIERQHWVQNNICGRSWGTPSTVISELASIVYLPNDNIDKVGQRVLALAESSPFTPFDDVLSENIAIERYAQHQAESRRSSGHSKLASDDHAEMTSTASELDTKRSKIQRTIIEDVGLHSVDLWLAAIKLLAYVRCILVHPRPPSFQISSRAIPTGIPPVADPTQQRQTYASRLMVTASTDGESKLAVTAFAARAVTPQIIRHTRPKRSGLQKPKDSLSSHTAGNPRRSTYKKTEEEKVGPLPVTAWVQIFTILADPDGLLSKAQTSAIVAWGRNRQNLTREMELRAKSASVQQWKLLDAVNCLFYDETI